MYRIGSVCEYYANWAAASSASWGCRLRWNALRLRVWRGYGYRMRSVCEPGGGLCTESGLFARITRIGRRPRRPRGAFVCDGMHSGGALGIESFSFARIARIGRRPRRRRGASVCESGGGMGIECAPFASLEGVCV